jgi:hypothetical protein
VFEIIAARSRIKPKLSTPANQIKEKPPNIHCLPSSLIMGRGFEAHNSHQQPTVRALHYHALAGQTISSIRPSVSEPVANHGWCARLHRSIASTFLLHVEQ